MDTNDQMYRVVLFVKDDAGTYQPLAYLPDAVIREAVANKHILEETDNTCTEGISVYVLEPAYQEWQE